MKLVSLDREDDNQASVAKEAWLKNDENEPGCSKDRMRLYKPRDHSSEGRLPGPIDLGKDYVSEDPATRTSVVETAEGTKKTSLSQPAPIVSHNSHKTVFKCRENKKRIERRKNLLSVVVKNATVYQYILTVYKHALTTLIISISWLFLTVFLMFVCFGYRLGLSYEIMPVMTFYMTSLFLHNAIFIRVDIVKELLRSFSFWFTMWNAVSFHTCFFLLYGWNVEVLGVVIHSFSSILLMIFLDAHAAKRSKMMKLSSLFGTLSYIPMFVALSFNLVEFEVESVYESSTSIELMNVRLQAIDNLATMIMYLFRIFYTHNILRKPNTIAFVSNYYIIETHSAPKKCQALEIAGSVENQEINHGNVSMEKKVGKINELGTETVVLGQPSDHGTQPKNAQSISSPANPLPNDSDQFLVIGIMDDKAIEFDPQNTFFHKYLIGNYPTVARLIKSRYYNLIGIMSTLISTVSSLLLSVGFGLGNTVSNIGLFVTICASMFMVVQIITTCNLSIYRHMLHSFDYWYILLLVTKVCISTGILCDWDIRMVFWFYTILTIVWFTMVDTFHSKARRMTYVSIIGITWSFTVAILCKLNIGDTFSEDKYIYFRDSQVMSSRIAFSTATFSVFIFFIRFLWSYHRNPSRLLFITENVTVR